MGGATEWVRRALAELGPDANIRQVTANILSRDFSRTPKPIFLSHCANQEGRPLAQRPYSDRQD